MSAEAARSQSAPEPREQAVVLTMQFMQRLHAGAAGGWPELNLSMPQLKALFLVDCLGPVQMHQLAHRLGISDSAATGLVERLVEHGLVRREHDPLDRRVVRVAATAAGADLLVQLRAASAERLSRILAHLDDRQVEQALRVLETLNGAAEIELRKLGVPLAVVTASEASVGGTKA